MVALDYKHRYDIYLPERTGSVYNRRLTDRMMWRTVQTEGMRIGAYRPGGKFMPHRDNDSPPTKRRFAGFVAAVNSSFDYTSGDLVFPELGVHVRLPRGSAILFDADLLHGVTPVETGLRLVLISFAYL